jgi:DNA-binding NtrC family response regulator
MNGIRVLVVDDEEGFVTPLVKRLKKRRLDVTFATGGRQALEQLRESPVDVVVLDVKMPDMDGLTTLKNLKQIDPTVEVVMLTGHASLEAAMEGMRLGAFDYLMKPVDIDELLFKLEDACKRRLCRNGSSMDLCDQDASGNANGH